MLKFQRECSTCGEVFSLTQNLQEHLKQNPSCRKVPNYALHLLTTDNLSNLKITPAADPKSTENRASLSCSVAASCSSNPTLSLNNPNSKCKDTAHLDVMVNGKRKSPPKESGLEVPVLSASTNGDPELLTTLKKLYPKFGAKVLTDIAEITVTKTKIDVNPLADLLKTIQYVSICFLVGTTGSMTRYINGIKNQIVQIVSDIQAKNCGIAGLSLVGYKDWSDGEHHFEIMQFTTKVDCFKKFVADIKAGGGGDVPEDVLGGLDKALDLIWPESSGPRILFHLGNAPPHGALYHSHRDDYPQGHPKDSSPAELFKRMRAKNVVYYFGRINHQCDRMLQIFETFYGDRIDTFDCTKVSTLTSHVTATVSNSCATNLLANKTGGSTGREFRLNKKEPDWPLLPSTVVTLLSLKLQESTSTITCFAKMEIVERKCLAQIAPIPFAKGVSRLVYYGRIIRSSSTIHNDVVFKEIVALPKAASLDRLRYVTDLEIQTVAYKLALEFNGRLAHTTRNPYLKLKFRIAKVIRFGNGKSRRFMTYETLSRGPTTELVKYTNNLGLILISGSLDAASNTLLELAVAFSHFTHSITDGYLLVCNLQGITVKHKKEKRTLLLTDPVIHCPKHSRFGTANLGAFGVSKFFSKHECNSFCFALGLMNAF